MMEKGEFCTPKAEMDKVQHGHMEWDIILQRKA